MIARYLRKEYSKRKNHDLNMKHWKMETAKNIPKQTNDDDCGLFICRYAEFLTRGANFSFNQEGMEYFRIKIVNEIFNNSISPF